MMSVFNVQCESLFTERFKETYSGIIVGIIGKVRCKARNEVFFSSIVNASGFFMFLNHTEKLV